MLKIKFVKVASLMAVAVALIALAPASARAFTGATCAKENIRWSSSNNRVYISGNAVCTLSDIKALGSKYIPLTLTDQASKTWFLGANIFLQNGSTLALHGGSAGDVNELRLKSDNVKSNGYVTLVANNGNIDIANTKITSWDEAKNGPDTEYDNYGRAYISVKSSMSGSTKLESTMNIRNSEIAYLGFYKSEAYGLSWKVLGGTNDIYNLIGVYGDVENSSIHNNFFGVYTFGGKDMTFSENEVYDNISYGLDFHDDSDRLAITDNTVSGNGWHGIICSKRCDHLVITGNNSSNNVGAGIMIHRNVTDSVIRDNTTNGNEDAGIALFDSYSNVISDNVSNGNRKGIRLSVGSSNNTIENNNFSDNTLAGVYTYKGTDAPTTGDGRIKQNIFQYNTIDNNGTYGLKLSQSDKNTVYKNYITNNHSGICLIDSKNNIIMGNILAGNDRNYCK